MLNSGLFSSIHDECETPDDFFSKLNSEFHFTLDLCASDFNHKCKRYYTLDDSCFTHFPQSECIFCNPPYGRSIIDFVRKCYYLSFSNKVVVLLLPARTDTIWFHKYIYNRSEIRFLKGRLKFSNSRCSAPFPSMLVIYRNFGKIIEFI